MPLFLLGSLLLVVPLIIIILLGSVCSGNANSCFNAGTTRFIDTIFPYPMLAGGLFIGYGMKRVADSKAEESEDDDDTSAESHDPAE